jgi:hypothetical protein
VLPVGSQTRPIAIPATSQFLKASANSSFGD